MLSKALKKNTQNYIKKNNLTVFGPKHPFIVCYGTDEIPLSQTATVNI